MFEIFRRLYRTHVYHKFLYKDFGDIKNARKQCPYCKQWFLMKSNAGFTWYDEMNGIIIDPKCTCHKWREPRLIKRKK